MHLKKIPLDQLKVSAVPCAVMAEGDDVAALEASLIENIARLDPDEVSRSEIFSRLVKTGRSVTDIAATIRARKVISRSGVILRPPHQVPGAS